jgi:hypothetical protein
VIAEYRTISPDSARTVLRHGARHQLRLPALAGEHRDAAGRAEPGPSRWPDLVQRRLEIGSYTMRARQPGRY